MLVLSRLGEVVRPVLLARKEKLPVADMFGIYALERVFDVASTAVIAAIALMLFNSNPYVVQATRTTGSLLILGVVGGIEFLVYARLHGSAMLEIRLQGWRVRHGWRDKIPGKASGFVRGGTNARTWGRITQ